ncbi:MAG: ATP-binding protein [Rhodanobacteraceae bacterium]
MGGKRRQPLSLAARSTLATGLILLVFLGSTGFALDHAYQESAVSALRSRMQSFIYAYMAGFDVSRYGKLIPPDTLPDPDFARPGSGLLASVTGPRQHWTSPSTMYLVPELSRSLKPSQKEFRGPMKTSFGRIFVLSEGVAWVMANGKELPLTFHVAEEEGLYRGQLGIFRRTLFYWLASIGLGLMVFQLLLLRWSLSPLRRMSHNLRRIESGERDQLGHHYPSEVSPLATGLDRFIDAERERIARYRKILADLAHSLKTPLSVIRSRLESEDVDSAIQRDLMQQVGRMDEIVAYQLSRAATTGHKTYAAPIAIEAEAEDLVRSLEKVYASKNVLCEFEIDEKACFYGERGDLLELLGNLLENAFKWANHRVLLRAGVLQTPGRRRFGLELAIEDDGPGIEPDQVEKILQRGVRGDERVQGHGIGLSIVQDIVHAYHADLEVGPSQELGGASFVIRILPD